MTRIKSLLASLLLFSLLLAGCSGTNPQSGSGGATDASPDVSLAGPTWQLLAFGEAADAPAASGDAEITATFDAGEGRVAGSAGCNRYFGTYETGDGGRLAFSQMGATRSKACASPVMEREQAYLDALEVVRGWERAGDRLVLLNAGGEPLLRFTARETSGNSKKAGAMEPQRTDKTYVYECPAPGGEPFSFTTRTGPGELAVRLPARFAEEGAQERYLVLGQVRSADGAKYQDGPVTVWTKGLEVALLEVGGQTFTDCTHDPQRDPWAEAKRRGMNFRAVGQEPGWHLEIRWGERIRFVYDYGEREVVTPAPEPTGEEATRTYHAETEAYDLTVTITDEPCTDAMSGERFEKTVTVELDGETYRGCGRALH